MKESVDNPVIVRYFDYLDPFVPHKVLFLLVCPLDEKICLLFVKPDRLRHEPLIDRFFSLFLLRGPFLRLEALFALLSFLIWLIVFAGFVVGRLLGVLAVLQSALLREELLSQLFLVAADDEGEEEESGDHAEVDDEEALVVDEVVRGFSLVIEAGRDLDDVVVHKVVVIGGGVNPGPLPLLDLGAPTAVLFTAEF